MSPRKAWIVGAGGCGREVLILARSMRESGWLWTIQGFLDSRKHLLDGVGADLDICGDPLAHTPKPDELFIIAQGGVKDRRKYAEALAWGGGSFLSIIPPAVYIPPSTRIGNGCVLSTGIILGPDVNIGDHTQIQSMAVLGHDVSIGNYCQIGAVAVLGGHVHLDDGVTVHPHAVLLPGIKVGKGSTVGAGAVVVQDVPPNATVFGNPARLIFNHQ